MVRSQEKIDEQIAVLVVDDDEAIRELVVWMLEDAGYAAASGSEALDFLHRHGRVHVVVSDINMPGMDDVQLRLKLRQSWPELPILLTSGRPAPQGVKPFLPKPFGWECLTAALSTLVPAGPTHLSAGL